MLQNGEVFYNDVIDRTTDGINVGSETLIITLDQLKEQQAIGIGVYNIHTLTSNWNRGI